MVPENFLTSSKQKTGIASPRPAACAARKKNCTAPHPFARPGASHVQRPERSGRRKPKDTDMTTQTLARPAIQPASSLVLERIFASPVPANDTEAARISLIVRRRERQRRRDVR